MYVQKNHFLYLFMVVERWFYNFNSHRELKICTRIEFSILFLMATFFPRKFNFGKPSLLLYEYRMLETTMECEIFNAQWMCCVELMVYNEHCNMSIVSTKFDFFSVFNNNEIYAPLQILWKWKIHLELCYGRTSLESDVFWTGRKIWTFFINKFEKLLEIEVI